MSGKRILIASGNPGKVREFSLALVPEGFDVVGMDALGDIDEIEETGETFEANARLKAEGYSTHADMLVLADDSGIEVDALDGRPGVQSARYGGSELDDDGRCRLMLHELDGVPDERRAARFRCVLALARYGETLATFNGVIEGVINHGPKGENGFGYDPLFFHPPSGCTTAQLAPAEKQKVSHRGKAIAAMLDVLRSGEVSV